MNGLKWALAAGLAIGIFGGFDLAAGGAAALPAHGREGALGHSASLRQTVEAARYICGYWRCHWVEDPYYWGGPFPGGPYWGGPYRRRHHWHHGHHWHHW